MRNLALQQKKLVKKFYLFYKQYKIMIQRIQSIYLLVVSILSSLMLIFPFAYISQEDILLEFIYKGLRSSSGEMLMQVSPILGMILVSVLASFISIFFYKKRILQIRMNVFNIILSLLLYLVGALY